MKVKSAKFYFSSNTFETEIIKDSYTNNEILHNNLVGADGNCSFKVPFSIDFSNLIQSEIGSNKIKVEIKDTDGKNINTYYIKDSVSIEKTQKGQPISINAISPSFFLDETLSRSIVCVNKTLGQVIQTLLDEINFKDYKNLVINEKLSYFTASEGDSVKSLINELLYEYSYIGYFDNDGFFKVKNLFATLPESTDDISQTLDGTNLREKIQITAKEKEADYVSANYKKVEYFENTLLFSDTQNATETDKCSIEVQPGYYMFESTEEKEAFKRSKKINYLDYDSTKGEVLYVSQITPDVIFDTGLDYTITRYDESKNDLINQASLVAYNGTDKTLYCRKLDIYGNAYISTAEEKVVSSYGTKVKEVELKYVYNKEAAEKFALNVANYYRYSNFEITAKSYDDFELGSYVKITDYGIGTYFGRIIQKKRTLKNGCIEYKIETIADYTPATIDKTTSTRKNTNAAGSAKGEKGDKGDKGEDISQYNTSTFCYLEKETSDFEIDDLGKVEEKEFYIPIHFLAENVELPFQIGEIEQKGGILVEPYYKDDGSAAGIHVKSMLDYELINDSVTIPIIFNEVAAAYVFGDDLKKYGLGNDTEVYGQLEYIDDSTYEYKLSYSWTVNYYGTYRGSKNSLDGFLGKNAVNLHRGDWFTWAGEETAARYKGGTITFKTGGVYKWNNHDTWEEDENWEHLIVCTNDLLDIGKEQLKINQKKMTELLTRLAENEHFLDELNNKYLADLLGANEELQDELAKQTNFLNQLNKSELPALLANNETLQDELTKNEHFKEDLNTNQIPKLFASQKQLQDELAKQTNFLNQLNKSELPALLANNETLQDELTKNEHFKEDLNTNQIPKLFASQKQLQDELAKNENFQTQLVNNHVPKLFASQEEVRKELSENEDYLEKLAGAKNTVFADKLVSNTTYTGKLVADNAFLDNLAVNNITTKLIDAGSLNANVIKSQSGYFDKLISNELFINTLNTNQILTKSITADNGFIDTLATNDIFTSKLTADTGFIDKLTVSDAYIQKVVAGTTFTDSLVANETYTKSLVATDAFIDNINTNTLLTNSITANDAWIDTLATNDIFTSKLTADTGFIDKLTVSDAYIQKVVAGTTFTDSLVANETYTKSLVATDAFIDNINTNTLLTNSITANDAWISNLVTNQVFTDDLTANQVFTDSLATKDVFTDKLAANTAFLDKLVAQKTFTDTISVADEAIFTRASEDATTKANNAQTNAIEAAATDATNKQNTIANNLGYSDFSDMSNKAAAGKTIIKGGYINTNLIDADTIISNVSVIKKTLQSENFKEDWTEDLIEYEFGGTYLDFNSCKNDMPDGATMLYYCDSLYNDREDKENYFPDNPNEDNWTTDDVFNQWSTIAETGPTAKNFYSWVLKTQSGSVYHPATGFQCDANTGAITASNIKATGGQIKNMNIENVSIIGNSKFTGDISSGPLYVSSENTPGATVSLPKGTIVSSTNMPHSDDLVNGTYGDIHFSYYNFQTAVRHRSSLEFKEKLFLYNSNRDIVKEIGNDSFSVNPKITLEADLNYTTQLAGTKTLRLLDLPTSEPAVPGTVWNDNGVLKIKM